VRILGTGSRWKDRKFMREIRADGEYPRGDSTNLINPSSGGGGGSEEWFAFMARVCSNLLGDGKYLPKEVKVAGPDSMSWLAQPIETTSGAGGAGGWIYIKILRMDDSNGIVSGSLT